jgi:hypothetical protein
MGISTLLLDMALQSRPAMPVSASLQPSRRRVTLTMWIPPITELCGCWGRNTKTQPERRHHPATNTFVRAYSLVSSFNYSTQVRGIKPPSNPITNITTSNTASATARTRPLRKEIPISPAPESLNSTPHTPINARIRHSAREPSDVDCTFETSFRRQHARTAFLMPF